jgi:subtilase family serine protease
MFVQGNAQGITFIFSSGDDSGLTCPQPGYILNPGTGASYVDVPGTSIWSDDPNVTSVGGTNLETVPNPNPTASPFQVTSSAYVSEEAYSDVIESPIDPFGEGNVITNARWGSGGGPSVIFAAPSYQAVAKTGSSMRVDPDISMHMGGCPFEINAVTGRIANEYCSADDSYDIAVLGGSLAGLIGTSASAPEFAGLLALREQLIGGRVGNANGYIYDLYADEAANGAYHKGIGGDNGVVSVKRGTVGYNPIIGVGTPDARKFLGVPNFAAAGNPQTPSNP